MPGFFICNRSVNIGLDDYYNTQCVGGELSVEGFTVKRHTLNRFLNDKLFAQDDDVLLIVEGVILNKSELCEKHGGDFFTTSKHMLQTVGSDFFKEYRGSFSGAVYEKKTDVWTVFASHIGDKPVFFYCESGLFMAASSELYITSALKEFGIAIQPDEKGIYEILNYGFMVSDRTLVQSIHTVQAGHYIEYSAGTVRTVEYHRLNNTDNMLEMTEDEIIDELDKRFSKAVRLEYEKDKEYGYRHLTELSGGLDSRMNLWVANELGYTDMVSLNFGQSDYLDEKIAKEVASFLGTELIIKPLDDAKLLADFREIVRMNFGLTIFYGSAHVNRIHQYINYSRFGLIHSGQVGDAIIGAHLDSDVQLPPQKLNGAYSALLSDKLDDSGESYLNNEQQFFYTRGFRGVLTSQLLRQNYTEIVSPFLYLDFLEFCLKIPLKMRNRHRIYYKWVQKKYPAAAKIPLERCYGGLMTEGSFKQKLRKAKQLGFKRLCIWALYKVGIIKEFQTYVLNVKGHMNPIDYWYNTKPLISETMDGYARSRLDSIETQRVLTATLISDIKDLYDSQSVTNKTLALTVLAAVEMFW